jgi:hypothetical protein
MGKAVAPVGIIVLGGFAAEALIAAAFLDVIALVGIALAAVIALWMYAGALRKAARTSGSWLANLLLSPVLGAGLGLLAAWLFWTATQTNSTNTSDIIDNNNFGGPETVSTSGAYALEISGPCTWTHE